MSENSIRLTQYSHGAGCGCKISPKVLETILHSEQAKFVDQMLMERHLSKKARRSSRKCHVKGPKKRTEEDDERFAQSFEKMLLMAREKEGR